LTIIKDLKDLVPSIDSLFPDMKRHTATEKCGPCPECGGEDRFIIYTESDKFWCRRCNIKGDNVDIVMERSNVKTHKELFEKLGGNVENENEFSETHKKILIIQHITSNSPKVEPNQSHYLDSKQVEPDNLLWNQSKISIDENTYIPEGLIAPLQCVKTGKVTGLKHIPEDGKGKRSHGKVTGSAYILCKARIEDQDIYIVEGIADALTLSQHAGIDIVMAACSSVNFKSLAETVREKFKDSRIIIASDGDTAGISKAQDTCRSVENCHMIEPGSPGIDFNDVLCSDGKEALHLLVSSKVPPKKSMFITFQEIYDVVMPEKPLVQGLIDELEPTIVHATGGIGKSLFTTELALILAQQKTPEDMIFFLERFRIPNIVSSLFIQSENSRRSMHMRLRKMCDHNEKYKSGLKRLYMPEIDDRVTISGMCFEDDIFKNWFKKLLGEIEKKRGDRPQIVFFDPLISYLGCDENDAQKMRSSLNSAERLCISEGVTPIVVHHDNKNGSYRGSSALYDWSRNFIGLKEQFAEISETRINAETCEEEEHTYNKRFIVVNHDKGSDHERVPSFYVSCTSNLTFQCEDGPSEKKEKKKTEKKGMKALSVLSLIKDTGCNAAMLKDGLVDIYNISESSAKKEIRIAVKENLIRKKKEGREVFYEIPK
jgi:phage/plasmid primase-like uncharacterized protein